MWCLVVIDRQVRKIYTPLRSRSEYEQGPFKETELIWLRGAQLLFRIRPGDKAGHEIITLNWTRKSSPESDSSLYIQAL